MSGRHPLPFPATAPPGDIAPMRRRAPFAILLLLLAGCATAARWLEEALRERPPYPLERLEAASDARLAPDGRLAGSFVGEGTPRAVHLVSSDTGLIAALVRRYRPDAIRRDDLWGSLARRRSVELPLRRPDEDPAQGVLLDGGVAGGPFGHALVQPVALRAVGSDCGWRGAQLELVVRDGRRGSPLRGPVLGAFRGEAEPWPAGGAVRAMPPQPSPALVDALLDRTRRALDSLSAPRRGPGPVPPSGLRLEVNSLADVDAADVVPYRVDGQRVRYAVALRERRVTARGDTLLLAGVMAWDSAGAWRQLVLRPTLLRLDRGRLVPGTEPGRAVYWRRLAPVSDLGAGRDDLWLEEVDVRDGSVTWAVVEPRGHVVVATAEVGGPCAPR